MNTKGGIRGPSKAVIRLFTTIYDEKSGKRRAELEKCFQTNATCKYINEICVLCEGGEELLPNSNKISIRYVDNRPTYQQYFDWIGEFSEEESLSIIANSDIFFDQQLAFLFDNGIPESVVYALSRWNWIEGGKPELYDHNDSQDAWILNGNPLGVFGEFSIGTPRCDNRIAAEFEEAGFTVLNPSFSLRCFHLHDGPSRPYLEECHSEEIPPPYKYIWPHNLLSLSKTLLHNIGYPSAYLYWRFDRRRFANWLPMRILLKIERLFQALV